MLIALQRIAADQFGEAIRLVGISRTDRAHLIKRDVDATLRQLPRGLTSCQPAADYLNSLVQILF